MEVTVQMIEVAERTIEPSSAWLAVFGFSVLVVGIVFFVLGLINNYSGTVFFAVVAMIIGVLMIGMSFTSTRETIQNDLEGRQETAIEHQLKYPLVIVEDGTYSAADENGQKHRGCLIDAGSDQFLLVPNGPNKDGECLIVPGAVPNP